MHDQDGEEAEQDHRQERPSGLQIDHRPGEPRPGNELAASKTKTSTTRKARTFDVLLPRLARAGEGLTFEGGDYVRLTGTVPAQLAAIRMTGSPLGVHAAAKGGDTSLCGVPVTSNGKAKAEQQATGQAAKVAPAVTCRFCEARLVAAGVKPAAAASPYGADYGTRDTVAQLAAIEAKTEKVEAAA